MNGLAEFPSRFKAGWTLPTKKKEECCLRLALCTSSREFKAMLTDDIVIAWVYTASLLWCLGFHIFFFTASFYSCLNMWLFAYSCRNTWKLETPTRTGGISECKYMHG